MTDEKLAAIEARYSRVVPTKPCRVCRAVNWVSTSVGGGMTSWACGLAADQKHANASTIVTSNGDPDVLALIAEVRRLRAEVKR